MSKQLFLPESICEIDSNMHLEKLTTLYQNHSTVIGKVTRIDFEKQFFVVNLGGKIEATMTFNEATIYPVYTSEGYFSLNITDLYEKVIQAKISSFENNNIILSRKDNMLEALETLKSRTESNVFAIVTGFSRMSVFMDIGAGVLGRSYSKHFCNVIFHDIKDIGIQKGDMVSVKIKAFLEDLKKFDLSRVETLPTSAEILNRGDIVTCTVFDALDDGIGYYVLIDTVFCGIVDSPDIPLHYGNKIQAVIKAVSPRGPKLQFIKKVKKF